MCIGPSSQFVPRKIIEISITNLWSFETSRAIFSDHWKFKLEKNTQACIIAGPVAKLASCEWSCKRAPNAWDILWGSPENFWNIDPRNTICSNLSIKFQKIAWSNDGKRCGYFGIFQTTIMKFDTKIGNLWSAVPLIIVIPAIVHFFSIRKYYMHVLYYHSLYRLPNF
jgi:hypothetical protein